MKRFWKEVTVEQVGDGWQGALDGRRLKTQGNRPQVVPSRALAELLAGEWAAQGEDVDPAGFAHRDMADYAIDMIASGEDDIVAKLLGFMETDTLCYRADPDEPLYRRQLEVWEPLVTAFEVREGVKVERASGILHRPQPAGTLAALKDRLETLDPLVIAALFSLTSLSASLIVGLAALEDDADPETLWNAANLEEDWQIELWGADEEAMALRQRRLGEFTRTMAFARAARG
ncbi:molecular chaperone [Erythrobacter sp. SDW2]|uniref:ATP12 family chaperone protein n=1 Tax=Erythrobacter sp. SDW2 TaxID=2907154 RepID=UPI001F3260D7|nr:ATP12 family protein [Erythrobacter sp. SDW2]UIP06575.1 molecular chaperone [Erythrobacter sp. SDW2]